MSVRKLINKIFGGAKVKTNDPSVKVEPQAQKHYSPEPIIKPTAIAAEVLPPAETEAERINREANEKHDREREERLKREEASR